MDPYDRIWDADEDFSPYHVSSGFDIQSNFDLSNIKEDPPTAVLQSGRVLARRNSLVYTLPLDNQGDYHVVLYFAGILPVSPAFDILINGNVVQSNYTVMRWQANSLFFTVKGMRALNLTLKAISYYPLVNALEVYEILDVPLESSSTAGLKLFHEIQCFDAKKFIMIHLFCSFSPSGYTAIYRPGSWMARRPLFANAVGTHQM